MDSIVYKYIEIFQVLLLFIRVYYIYITFMCVFHDVVRSHEILNLIKVDKSAWKWMGICN